MSRGRPVANAVLVALLIYAPACSTGNANEASSSSRPRPSEGIGDVLLDPDGTYTRDGGPTVDDEGIDDLFPEEDGWDSDPQNGTEGPSGGRDAGREGGTSPRPGKDGATEPPPADVDDPPAMPPADTACCSDGNCVCRGGEPSAALLQKRGTFKTASYSKDFRKGKEFGGATVFYPTDAAPPLSGVVMAPGYGATQTAIAAWGPFFASHGVVLVTMDGLTVNDPVEQRAKGLLDALESLKAENTREGSPLKGKLSADRFGLAGWSHGGGGAWMASATHPELKSVVTLAGHNASAGGGMIAAASKVPTLMLNGAKDSGAIGGAGQTQAAFKGMPADTPKLMYIVTGEDHLPWGTPAAHGNVVGLYVMAWEKTFLENDSRYKKLLLQKGPDAAEWETNVQ